MKARGFTLIEALIGLVILSVGLLGAAAMLLGSLGSHADALRRAAALTLVRDVADRIRANGAARAGYASAGLAAAADCSASPCDAAALAASDRAYFERCARDRFPVGTVADIQVEPATGPAAPDRYVISLRFRSRSLPDVTDGVALTVLVHAPVAGA
ncbi:MAG TPA: type IV pilus modification protein PilV [Steroidobacteraceae bacterium]|nr:type IV pilus modification protein PilV [Steroidobacteraceae bacterium]